MISRDKTAFETSDKITYSNFPERLLEYSKYADLVVITCAKGTKDPRYKRVSNNVELYGVSCGPIRYVAEIVWGVIKLGAGKKPDVITTQDPFFAGLSGLIAKKILKRPLVVQLHGDLLDNPYWISEAWYNPLLNLLGKAIVRRADAVRTVSTRVAEKIRANLNPNAYVAPIYTDVEKYAKGKDKKLEKFKNFDNVVLFVGRLVESKNVGALIESAVEVLKNYPKTAFVIVGDGPQEEELIGQAKRAGISQNVFFEGATSKTIPYYKSCDFLVLPSKHEGWGLVLVEALAAGKPVITTDVGCVGDIVFDGENGLVVEKDSSTSLTRAIIKMIEDPKTRKRFGKAGQERVLFSISPEKNAQDFMSILQSVSNGIPSKRLQIPNERSNEK